MQSKLKIIKDLGKTDRFNNRVINVQNNGEPKTYAQAAKQSAENQSQPGIAVLNENNIVSENIYANNTLSNINVANINVDNTENANCSNINSVNRNSNFQEATDISSTLDKLVMLEKVLSNICSLCERLDKSDSAKALGLQNLLAKQFGSLMPNIPH